MIGDSVAMVAPVPIVVVAPTTVARILEIATGIARRFAVTAPTLDRAIEPPFGMLNTFVAAAPVPRLRLGRRGTTQQHKRGKTDAPKKRFHPHRLVLPMVGRADSLRALAP